MTGTADRNDYAAVIRRLEERVRVLETSTPAARTSITRGATTAGAAFLTSEGGGRVGSGASFFRSDGALTNSGGTLPVAVNMTGASNATFEGEVRGRTGVVGPIDGVQTELGAAVKEADRKGQSGYDNAIAARAEAAEADRKGQSGYDNAIVARNAAATAQSGVNGLASRMGAVEGDITALTKTIGLLDTDIAKIIAAFNALKVRVAELDNGDWTPISRSG